MRSAGRAVRLTLGNERGAFRWGSETDYILSVLKRHDVDRVNLFIRPEDRILSDFKALSAILENPVSQAELAGKKALIGVSHIYIKESVLDVLRNFLGNKAILKVAVLDPGMLKVGFLFPEVGENSSFSKFSIKYGDEGPIVDAFTLSGLVSYLRKNETISLIVPKEGGEQ